MTSINITDQNIASCPEGASFSALSHGKSVASYASFETFLGRSNGSPVKWLATFYQYHLVEGKGEDSSSVRASLTELRNDKR